MEALSFFPGYTRIIGKPINMTDDHCYSLSVRDTDVYGFAAMESVWELSDSDIEAILKSKRISLTVLGSVHPPVIVQVSPLVGGFKSQTRMEPKNPPSSTQVMCG